MAEQNGNGSAIPQETVAPAADVAESKGKGKAAAAEQHDTGMDVDSSSSDEEVDEVCYYSVLYFRRA